MKKEDVAEKIVEIVKSAGIKCVSWDNWYKFNLNTGMKLSIIFGENMLNVIMYLDDELKIQTSSFYLDYSDIYSIHSDRSHALYISIGKGFFVIDLNRGDKGGEA